MGLILESTLREWTTIGLVLVSCVYWYYRNVFNFWKKRGVKYVKPEIPFGNSKDLALMRVSLTEFFKGLYDAFPGERYMGIYEFNKPTLLVRDPELIKHVLVKDFAHFQVNIQLLLLLLLLSLLLVLLLLSLLLVLLLLLLLLLYGRTIILE